MLKKLFSKIVKKLFSNTDDVLENDKELSGRDAAAFVSERLKPRGALLRPINDANFLISLQMDINSKIIWIASNKHLFSNAELYITEYGKIASAVSAMIAVVSGDCSYDEFWKDAVVRRNIVPATEQPKNLPGLNIPERNIDSADHSETKPLFNNRETIYVDPSSKEDEAKKLLSCLEQAKDIKAQKDHVDSVQKSDEPASESFMEHVDPVGKDKQEKEEYQQTHICDTTDVASRLVTDSDDDEVIDDVPFDYDIAHKNNLTAKKL